MKHIYFQVKKEREYNLPNCSTLLIYYIIGFLTAEPGRGRWAHIKGAR